MHLNLKDKVVLVTGGTKGIGRSIVQGFLDEGAIVHYCSRTAADIEASKAHFSSTFPATPHHGSVVDVSSTEQLTQWIHTTAAASSHRIDVLVSNVSALTMADTAADWTKAFEIDMLAVSTLFNTALPYLAAVKGNLVTIGSVSGRDVDFTAPSPYGAFKAALVHYTAQLARTHASAGIRANTVSPGNIYIADGVWGGIERGNPELFRRQFEANPMGRMGKPEEVADAVLFLASNDRAGFVSGSNLVVDGALCTGVQF